MSREDQFRVKVRTKSYYGLEGEATIRQAGRGGKLIQLRNLGVIDAQMR